MKITTFERSHQTCSIEKGVPKNFTNFTRKHLSLRPATSFKKIQVQVFSCEFCEIFRNAFSIEHLWMTASTSSNAKFLNIYIHTYTREHFLWTLFLFSYRFLSYNRLRSIVSASFFGNYDLRELWVCFFVAFWYSNSIFVSLRRIKI